MSNDNLILTEHAIKRHAKRLQKQMKNYSQDLSLGESQNLLSKILGFNDWNHLNTILKPAIENYENNHNLLIQIKNIINTKELTENFLASNLNIDSDFFENVQKNCSVVLQNYFQFVCFLEKKHFLFGYYKHNFHHHSYLSSLYLQ